MVAAIGDIGDAVRIHRDSRGCGKLRVTTRTIEKTLAAIARQRDHANPIDQADALVAGVGHEHFAGRTHGERLR